MNERTEGDLEPTEGESEPNEAGSFSQQVRHQQISARVPESVGRGFSVREPSYSLVRTSLSVILCFG